MSGDHTVADRLLEIRKYLNKDHYDSKRPKGDHGPPPHYAVHPQSQFSPYGPAPPFQGYGGPFQHPQYFEPPSQQPKPLWERLFGLSDDERARELLAVDEEYFITEQQRLERQLRELGRLQVERRRLLGRIRSDTNEPGYRERPVEHGYRDRSPVSRENDRDSREPIRGGYPRLPSENPYAFQDSRYQLQDRAPRVGTYERPYADSDASRYCKLQSNQYRTDQYNFF